MTRIKDYVCFAGWFSGLGYIVLWPVTSTDFLGKPFGAAVACHGGGPGVTEMLCNSAAALQLPPGLHALGFLSALFVTARLLMHSIRRARCAAGLGEAAAVPAPVSHAALALRRLRQPPPPRRPIKPRTHFGLRGVPR